MAEVALMKYCRVCVTEAGGGWSGADEVLSCVFCRGRWWLKWR